MVTKVISELKSVSELKIFPETGNCKKMNKSTCDLKHGKPVVAKVIN